MTPKIYILLPVHNRKEITRLFVDSLKKQTFPNFQLLLIDDGSTDGTAEMVKEVIPSVVIIQGSGDWWWAGSLQQGLNWLKEHKVEDSDLILFINDDVEFESHYLETAARVMASKKRTLVLSKFVASDYQVMETGIFADLRHFTFELVKPDQQINCLSTRGLFVKWMDVKEIGNFRPDFLPHYGSDYEYTLRAFRKGLVCETSGDLLIMPNLEATGFHKLEKAELLSSIKKLFSRKSPSNPVYRSMLVLLTVPPIWIMPNLIRVWAQAARMIASLLIKRN